MRDECIYIDIAGERQKVLVVLELWARRSNLNGRRSPSFFNIGRTGRDLVSRDLRDPQAAERTVARLIEHAGVRV